jgi:hypothetical protein
MDAVTLDHLLAEAAPSLVGRHVRRVRAAGARALVLELPRSSLWLDLSHEAAGAYVLDRRETDALLALAPGEPDASSRQALLHFRKHVAGARLDSVRRVEGERVLVIALASTTVVVRLARPSSATLAVRDEALARFGGEATWPPPEPRPDRGWQALTDERVAAIAAGARPVATLLEACPELGPALASRAVQSPSAWPALRAQLLEARPFLALPGPLERVDDAALLEAGAVALAPIAPASGSAVEGATWTGASRQFLEARLRAAAFASRRRPLLEAARTAARRLAQLERHLEQDLADLPAEEPLRRQAEALLASPAVPAPAAEEIEVADPYDAGRTVRVRLDPRLTVPANADRLFARARRVARAVVQIGERLSATRAELAAAREREERVLSARNADELPLPAAARSGSPSDERGPRRFLTARGVMMLVGRGARENHRLTFQVARPEDLWLHARDSAGAHVILRDPEGRAGAEDVREAAEVAAFYSRSGTDGQVDVHVTRRKHVQSAGGGAGRVRVVHSDTVRVTPRDPDGRLRER